MGIKTKLAALSLAFSVALGGSQALADTDLFAELEQAAESARELQLLEPLDLKVMTREEYREEQSAALLEESVDTEDSEDWNRLYIFLGFIDDGEDINEIYNSMISESSLGTYDPSTKQLVIISTNPDGWNAIDKSTFVHETVHALQDQNFDISGFFSADSIVSDDAFYASRSFIEGDASFAEVIYVIENDLVQELLADYETIEEVDYDQFPLFLMETTTFYYNDGYEFIEFFWQQGGWEAVNEVWQNPPTTSEQIMNPQKYVDGEVAVPVVLADPQPLFGADWRVIENNAWGELGTRIFIQNGGASSREASTAAEGWGGDGVYVITNDEETAMVWSTVWDTEEDATEFFLALGKTETGRLDGSSNRADESTIHIAADGKVGMIVQDGDAVIYYLAESEDSLNLLIESQMDADFHDLAPATPAASPVASAKQAVQFWIREQ